MRLAFLSNGPWTNTGYGMQCKNVVTRLHKKGHAISVQAFHGHQGSPIDWNGITIYGSVAHPFGFDVMRAHADNFQADVIISNFDAWVMEPQMLFEQRWVAWFPVDSEPCPPGVADKVRQAFHRIVWTEFGAQQMDKIGLDYDRVPYGVDVDVFMPVDKKAARETAHMPQDKFIVGMVAMNKGYPPRKAFYENIAAFKKFHDKHPDSLLYMHTLDGSRPNGETIDLLGYCKAIGLKHGEDVVFAEQYSYVLGYPETAMNTLYNCFDVHLLVSMGEGFGMPQLEAQAAGVPVICGDWTTMPELCFSGWKVDKKDATPQYTLQNAYQYLPRVDAIVDKLELAYKHAGSTMYQTNARKGALKYDINKVIDDHWMPVLAKIEKKIADMPKNKNVADNLKGLR
jgi:glycosyltransferase involved in cell wall biosynthesis